MVNLKNISYGQLRKGNWLSDKDPYGLAAFVDDNVCQTFIDNPNNDELKTAVLLAVDNGAIVGRSLYYGTRIKFNNIIVNAQSFGSIEVHYSQRGQGIGSMIRDYLLNNDEYPISLFSLLSSSCLSIMRKKEGDCIIFDFPELIKIVNTYSAFACRGLSGILLKICTFIGNVIIHSKNVRCRKRLKKLKQHYTIAQETEAPQWAGDMCMNDGHDYAEVHDNAWLNWNLTHNLSGKERDTQAFYSIYRGQTPIGFFLIKERLRDDVSQDMVCATLCEWASIDDELNETDINILALDSISPQCYYFRTITDSNSTIKNLHHFGFRNHGTMQMGFRDKFGIYPGLCDMGKWRIRFGCCNSIIY